MEILKFGYDKIKLLLQQGRYELAVKEVLERLQTEPDDAWLHAYLGFCFLKLNKAEEGVSEAKKAIALEPDLDYPYQLLSAFHEKQNELVEAEVAVKQALRLNPLNASYHCFLGRIYFNQHRVTEALEAVNSGLELDPEHVECQNLKGRILVRLGNKNGTDIFESSLSIDPENYYTHTNYGVALVEGGRVKEAIPHFKEALRINPNYELAQRSLLSAIKLKNPFYNFIAVFTVQFQKYKYATLALIIIGFLVSLIYSFYLFAPFLVLLFFYLFVDVFANFFLRFNKYSRRLLYVNEIRQTNVLLIFIAVIITLVTYGKVETQPFFYDVAYVLLGILIFLICLFFRPLTEKRDAFTNLFSGVFTTGLGLVLASYFMPGLEVGVLFLFNLLLAILALFRKKL